MIVDRQSGGRVPRLGSAGWLALEAGLPERFWDDAALGRYARRRRLEGRLVVVVAVLLAVVWDLIAVGRDMASIAIGWPLAMVAGACAGRIIPELVGLNRRPGPVRVAVLSSRSPLRFVTMSARRWLVASVTLAVSGAVASLWSGQGLRDDLLPIAASVVLAACGLLAVVTISRRSQPAGSFDDVLVDDAIRSIGTTSAISGWAALQCLLAMWLRPVPATLADTGWAWASSLLGWACWIGLAGAWAWMPTRVGQPAVSAGAVAA